jgi:hypothetical protein
MSIPNFLRNPVVAFADYRKRRELKHSLLALMAKRAPGNENGIQFEGVTLENPTPEAMTIVLVLQEIAQDRQFSIQNWPGGIALVRTAQVDSLNKDIADVNEKANFIIRGGTDKAADLLDNPARPTGTVTEDGVKNKGE